MLFQMTKKIRVHSFCQNLLARKNESFLKDQLKKVYIFIYIFGNKTISGTILEIFLSLATNLIFSSSYACLLPSPYVYYLHHMPVYYLKIKEFLIILKLQKPLKNFHKKIILKASVKLGFFRIQCHNGTTYSIFRHKLLEAGQQLFSAGQKGK